MCPAFPLLWIGTKVTKMPSLWWKSAALNRSFLRRFTVNETLSCEPFQGNGRSGGIFTRRREMPGKAGMKPERSSIRAYGKGNDICELHDLVRALV
jgi:hypothetical protein